MTNPQLDRLSEVLKTLTDPTRLRILWLLQTQGELSTKAMYLLIQFDQNGLLAKLGHMVRLNLLKRRRDGQLVYYSLVDPRAFPTEIILRIGQLGSTPVAHKQDAGIAYQTKTSSNPINSQPERDDY